MQSVIVVNCHGPKVSDITVDVEGRVSPIGARNSARQGFRGVLQNVVGIVIVRDVDVVIAVKNNETVASDVSKRINGRRVPNP